MVTTWSVEARIARGLRELHCSGRLFVALAKALGIKISEGKFFQSINGIGRLDSVGEQLLTLIDDMRRLVESSDIPPSWSNIEKISTFLALQRIARNEHEHELSSDFRS